MFTTGGVYFNFPFPNAAFMRGRRLKEEIHRTIPQSLCDHMETRLYLFTVLVTNRIKKWFHRVKLYAFIFKCAKRFGNPSTRLRFMFWYVTLIRKIKFIFVCY